MRGDNKIPATVTTPLPREGQGSGVAYQKTIDYLFNVAPMFQNIGAGAYKEGLQNTRALDEHFGHPHHSFKTIHVGGTNGKGSVSHTLAAILQSAGYKVGLYTSPHLVDFRERIRVNGEMIPEQRVIDFVEQERSFFEPLYPSFFELATALAFKYFEEQQVDIAVIEVGLGGRLDCTNIITPLLSVITNISLEHTQFLGDTLEKIAGEKAGIIKPNVPVIIGETNGHEGVREVFLEKAKEMNAPITFADEEGEIISWQDGTYETHHFGTFEAELRGLCQEKNTATILEAVKALRALEVIDPRKRKFIHYGFAHVCKLTGLMGRWQKIQDSPTVICDTAHNPGGLQYIAEQLRITSYELRTRNSEAGTQNSELGTRNSELGTRNSLRIVLGMVSDKDVRTSLAYFPKEASYYFTQASVRRAMPAEEIAEIGRGLGLQSAHEKEGKPLSYPTVAEAYQAALRDASPNDFIFVGGSSFIVADLLTYLQKD